MRKIFLLLLLFPSLSFAFTGKVVGISDGDTISVMHKGKAQKVRLAGIDAPEKNRISEIEQNSSPLTLSLERSWRSENTTSTVTTGSWGRITSPTAAVDDLTLVSIKCSDQSGPGRRRAKRTSCLL